MSRLMRPVAVPRRAFGNTIAELAAGIMQAAVLGSTRANSIELRLPIELGITTDGGELTGDLPFYRRATAFDKPPAQVTIVLAEMALEAWDQALIEWPAQPEIQKLSIAEPVIAESVITKEPVGAEPTAVEEGSA